MKKRNLILLIAIMVLSIFILGRFGVCAIMKGKAKDDLYQQVELFSDAITYIRANYVEEKSAKELIYGALSGMLASLDPHSQFMDPESFKEIKSETKGEFGGLGIEISIRDGLLTVISPLEDSPAHKAGIRALDRIVKIDGVSTKDITLIDAVKKLRGKPGTEVVLTILRESEGRIFDLKITRSIIQIEGIKEAAILEDNIGYIRLAEFQEKTPKDLEEALNKLKKDGMDGLVLDLRNNPGGLLDVAVKVADKFLAKEKVVVITKGRLKEDEVTYKSGNQPSFTGPLVVLVNDGSASASEIVAGAIQDNGRGIIVGTKSFGKGSVQTIIPLKDESALRLTTAKYLTPLGRVIHDAGIMPDVVVEQREEAKPDELKEKVEEVFEKVEEKPKKKRPYDEQLQRAIDLLKGIKVYKRFEKT